MPGENDRKAGAGDSVRANRPSAEVVNSAVALLRESFRNDGAEGESVHLILDEFERQNREYQAWIAELEGPTPAELIKERDTARAERDEFEAQLHGKETEVRRDRRLLRVEVERLKASLPEHEEVLGWPGASRQSATSRSTSHAS